MKKGKAVVHMTPAEVREELIARTIKYMRPYRAFRDPTTDKWSVVHVDPVDETRCLIKDGMSATGSHLWAERLSHAWVLGRISKNEDS